VGKVDPGPYLREKDGTSWPLGLEDKTTTQSNRAPQFQEYSIDYSMSQIPCFPDLVNEESASDKWLAEGHVFRVIDLEHPEAIAA